jgi:hypothetical protein
MKDFLKILVGVVVGALLVGGGVAVAETAGGPWDTDTQDLAIRQQNQITERLVRTQPSPNIKYSVERQNLIQRYKTYSDRNKISYIATVTFQGGILYTGVVKGKISSVSSQLTPADRMVCADISDESAGCSTVQVPEPDGSWSTNGQGIFWYDDRGVYHEWNGTYFVSDAPFTLTQPPVLEIQAGATLTSGG